MNKKYTKALFIFRRDLRIDDNTGLLEALEKATTVIPCFIFDPVQIAENNPYRSDNLVQFMIESLKDLTQQLEARGGRLYLFHGKPHDIVNQLIEHEKIDAVFVNRDYTPYSKKRDLLINNICNKKDIDFCQVADALINDPEQSLKKDGEPYTIFTPFFKRASLIAVREPVKNSHKNYAAKHLTGQESEAIYKKILPELNKNIFAHGGRSVCLKIIKHLGNYKNYTKERDIPALEKTTGLSAHLKFGTCSVREIYCKIQEKLGSYHPLLRQLYWRDFFTHIAFHFPHIFGHAFHEKYEHIDWENNKKNFDAWRNGMTGFPIVDAGMRQLNATGFMHNRVRMIVASFLTKDLHIDWRWGEQYFAQKLVDYDPAVNNGNWQWAASTGCDAQPYFRIFNPWLQQKRFDPECLYIKQWIPELKLLTPKQIHGWCNQQVASNYPKPIVDHAEKSAQAKIMYKKSFLHK